MTTLEMNQARVDLAREILSTDNVELINTLCRAARRFAKRQVSKQLQVEELTHYTMEEIDNWMDEAEAESGGMPSQEVFNKLEQKYPFLCNYK